jgi:hypothetical protein
MDEKPIEKGESLPEAYVWTINCLLFFLRWDLFSVIGGFGCDFDVPGSHTSTTEWLRQMPEYVGPVADFHPLPFWRSEAVPGVAQYVRTRAAEVVV